MFVYESDDTSELDKLSLFPRLHCPVYFAGSKNTCPTVLQNTFFLRCTKNTGHIVKHVQCNNCWAVEPGNKARVDLYLGLPISIFQVTWLVEGPEPGREHLDIDASSIQGTLMLVAGQR